MHSTVHFRVRDIIHPRPVEVLYELYEQNCLQGEVIALTDDGQEAGGYMVVRVRGLSEPVIVPACQADTFYETAAAGRSWSDKAGRGLTPPGSNLKLQ